MVPFTFRIWVSLDATLTNETELNQWIWEPMNESWLEMGKNRTCQQETMGSVCDRQSGWEVWPILSAHVSSVLHRFRHAFSNWLAGDELHPIRSNYGTNNWGYIEGTSTIEIDVDENEVYSDRPQDLDIFLPLETNRSLLIFQEWDHSLISGDCLFMIVVAQWGCVSCCCCWEVIVVPWFYHAEVVFADLCCICDVVCV